MADLLGLLCIMSLVFCHFSKRYLGSGVVLDCMDSWYLPSFLLLFKNKYSSNNNSVLCFLILQQVEFANSSFRFSCVTLSYNCYTLCGLLFFLSTDLFCSHWNESTLVIFRGWLYSYFSFGEVYRRIYGWKFSFTVTRERSRKTWFPNVYPTIYLPKWKIWIWLSPF